MLATAVAEVGRDHDYDWAIVEPSSMRSIIQLAGRVAVIAPDMPRINRICTCSIPMWFIWLRAVASRFFASGLEDKSFLLASHRLPEILTPEQWQPLPPLPASRERDPLALKNNLADLNTPA